MTARSMAGGDLVDEQAPARGETDRGDPAVLHAGLLDGSVVVEEGALAHVERARVTTLLTSARVSARTTHAAVRSSPAAAAHHHDAVGARPRAARRRRRHRGRVREVRVDLARRSTSAGVLPDARAARTGAPSRSGCSSAGWRVRVPIDCMTTTVGAAFDPSSPSRHPGRHGGRVSWTTRHRPPRCQRTPARAHRAGLPAGLAQRRRLRRARRRVHPRRHPRVPARPGPGPDDRRRRSTGVRAQATHDGGRRGASWTDGSSRTS